jgi:thiol-disulfide isomerase/thioredoxin
VTLLAALSVALDLGLFLPQDAEAPRPDPPLPAGIWHAWLDSPGGQLPFQLELLVEDEHVRAILVHDNERTPTTSTRVAGREIEMIWADFDSVLSAKISNGGMALDGTWDKQRDRTTRTRLGFHARFGLDAGQTPAMPLLTPAPPRDGNEAARAGAQTFATASGRYAVQFANDKEPAVALLEEEPGGRLRGTFLTTLGDYRYLTGQRTGNGLTLACFDGVHAFLFRAQRLGQHGWQGQFWSGDAAAQTWTAQRDARASLPDPYGLTRVKNENLGDLQFSDLLGQMRSLADAKVRGRACVLLLFGSWCPNCHDATVTLRRLYDEYAAQGLRVVGLAFELTDDQARNRRVLTAYAKRHQVEWPILLAGPADKKLASKAVPFLDRVVAYPTVVFADANGNIDSVYTGFTGPAAGREHRDLVADWRSRIESILR